MWREQQAATGAATRPLPPKRLVLGIPRSHPRMRLSSDTATTPTACRHTAAWCLRGGRLAAGGGEASCHRAASMSRAARPPIGYHFLSGGAGGGQSICVCGCSGGKGGWSCLVLCFEGFCRRTGRFRVPGRVHLMRVGATRTTPRALRTRSAGNRNSSQSRRYNTP